MIHELTSGQLTAVADEKGGELISLKDSSGKEYLWQGDPAFWSGRNPNLFPIVGGLKDGTVRFNGIPYHMNRHGFARNSNFSTIEKGEDFIEFELVESESTLQQYPFPFSFRVRHHLSERGFTTTFTVSNPGNSPLPFCIGAHTAFNCPGEFSGYRLVFDQPENAYALTPSPAGCLSRHRKEYALPNTDTIALDHSTFDRVDTLVFRGLNSTSVSLLSPDGHGVKMDFEVLPFIAFWSPTGKEAPFVCMEPWHGCAAFEDESGEFSDKPDCIILAPGESKTLHYSVSII